jgi:outer membrane murein-binding lipoprotein Lpp
MSDYEKTFVASDSVTSLNSYIAKLADVRAAAENAAAAEEETEELAEA